MSQFVPDGLKDEKYWARRRKNNMAAKRSRDARRLKENQIALRAGFLEKEVCILVNPTTLVLFITNHRPLTLDPQNNRIRVRAYHISATTATVPR